MIPTTSPTIDPARIQLLHSVQNHTIPVLNTFLLMIILHLPFLSENARFDLYFSLTNQPVLFAASHHFSPLAFLLLINFYPLILLGIIVLVIIFLVHLFKAFKLLLESFMVGIVPQSEKTYLELVFPSVTAKTALATEQLYKLLHTRGRQTGWFHNLTKQKKIYSLEIISSRDSGIRYIMGVPKVEADLIHQTLLSYLPGLKVREMPDYLETELGGTVNKIFQPHIDLTPAKDQNTEENHNKVMLGVIELTLGSDFSLPLQDQKVLTEHDQISFLTGTMTKLLPGEFIAFQIVTTPISSSRHTEVINRMKKVRKTIAEEKPLSPLLNPSFLEKVAAIFPINFLVFTGKIGLEVLKLVFLFIISIPSALTDTSGKTVPLLMHTEINLPPQLNTFEKELHQIVKGKLDQHLFETTIRILIALKDNHTFNQRAESIVASVGPFTNTHQSLTAKGSILPSEFLFKRRLNQFKNRQLSRGFGYPTVLSASELADLYHFPYTDITKVEGLVKNKSKDLPAPLSMKKSDTRFDVILGYNDYGGEKIPIGLTLIQRELHTYMIGKTGMGKSELLKSLIRQDMENGKGVAVLDPHGDLFYDILGLVPQKRIRDVVVFNPSDTEYPVGLNLLNSGVTFKDRDEGIDKVVSTTLAVFQKITDEKYWGPRLEHVLRNATQTALFTPIPSFWTVQKLLTSSKTYQKEVAQNLTDPVLRQFWAGEFSLLGKMQQSEVTAPVTNRIGKFLTSHLSRNILLQEKSAFNIQEVMDEGKILLVNLSKGELGEDQSHFFGSLMLSLIQLSAYQRIHILESKRRDFFLYVDEFQNFATPIFKEMSAEGRKWHVPLFTCNQNIAQIEDLSILKIITGNANNLIALRGSPDDEEFILPFMAPEVEKGEIVNLAPYHFYMKVGNKSSEDAFSGETELIPVEAREETAKQVIEYSRKHYATPKKQVEEYLEKLFKTTTGKNKKETAEVDETDEENDDNLPEKTDI